MSIWPHQSAQQIWYYFLYHIVLNLIFVSKVVTRVFAELALDGNSLYSIIRIFLWFHLLWATEAAGPRGDTQYGRYENL